MNLLRFQSLIGVIKKQLSVHSLFERNSVDAEWVLSQKNSDLAGKDSLSTHGDSFKDPFRTKKYDPNAEAYNWVVSICLKYVSSPWNMVNSLRRDASEPCAWSEHYNDET